MLSEKLSPEKTDPHAFLETPVCTPSASTSQDFETPTSPPSPTPSSPTMPPGIQGTQDLETCRPLGIPYSLKLWTPDPRLQTTHRPKFSIEYSVSFLVIITRSNFFPHSVFFFLFEFLFLKIP